VGAFHGHQFGHRVIVFGDEDGLALFDRFNEGAEAILGVGHTGYFHMASIAIMN
jgi:hypothetical protein